MKPCERCGGETFVVGGILGGSDIYMCKECGNYVEECQCLAVEIELPPTPNKWGPEKLRYLEEDEPPRE